MGNHRASTRASLAWGLVATRPALMPRPEAEGEASCEWEAQQSANRSGTVGPSACPSPSLRWAGAGGPQNQMGGPGARCLSVRPSCVATFLVGRPGAARSPSRHPRLHHRWALCPSWLTRVGGRLPPMAPGCREEVWEHRVQCRETQPPRSLACRGVLG